MKESLWFLSKLIVSLFINYYEKNQVQIYKNMANSFKITPIVNTQQINLNLNALIIFLFYLKES